ncbi:MAG: hypothetical protein JW854_06280 [Actinobacteria bacterium]|nr:hypothetical protein [Actinomycetota bacterium]
MALRRCRKCGLPLRLSRGYVWPGNGVILARNDPTMRMHVVESDLYAHVWSELEERLDVNISDAMIRGQRAADQDYLESNIIYGWRRFAAQHLPLRMMFKRITNEIALFGFGGIELLEYRKKKILVMKVKHSFDIITLAWGAKGVIEFAEKMGSELAWRNEGDDIVLSIQLVPREEGAKEVELEAMRRIRDAKRELALAGRQLPPQGDGGGPCPSCGLPAALTELEWRDDEGTIYRRDDYQRFIFTTGHIFVAVIRDLEKKLDRDLEPLLIDIIKDYHLRRLQGIPIRTRHGAYRAAARYLLAGGFGEMMDFNCGEGYLEMTIANPFYPPRLVGRIAGLFEYVEDEEADVSYSSPQPQLLKLEIRAT